jgi:hypothetical protein
MQAQLIGETLAALVLVIVLSAVAMLAIVMTVNVLIIITARVAGLVQRMRNA